MNPIGQAIVAEPAGGPLGRGVDRLVPGAGWLGPVGTGVRRLTPLIRRVGQLGRRAWEFRPVIGLRRRAELRPRAGGFAAVAVAEVAGRLPLGDEPA